MKTAVFELVDIYTTYKDGTHPLRRRYIRGDAHIYVDLKDREYLEQGIKIKASRCPPDQEAWDYSGSYLGKCVDMIDDDPDVDTFYMDSTQMIQEIRRLRKLMREKNGD